MHEVPCSSTALHRTTRCPLRLPSALQATFTNTEAGCCEVCGTSPLRSSCSLCSIVQAVWEEFMALYKDHKVSDTKAGIEKSWIHCPERSQYFVPTSFQSSPPSLIPLVHRSLLWSIFCTPRQQKERRDPDSSTVAIFTALWAAVKVVRAAGAICPDSAR